MQEIAWLESQSQHRRVLECFITNKIERTEESQITERIFAGAGDH